MSIVTRRPRWVQRCWQPVNGKGGSSQLCQHSNKIFGETMQKEPNTGGYKATLEWKAM